MNCALCKQRYAMAEHVPDASGLLQPMCIECAAREGRPATFPAGTQRNGRMPPQTDFVDHAAEGQARLLEIHTAQRDRLAYALQAVLYLFRRELAAGYSTAEMQQALREARAVLVEVGL